MYINKIKQLCEQTLEVKRKGGQLVIRDDYTLLLLDYDFLSSQQILLITERFPRVVITTHQSQASSTGYYVLFSYKPRGNWWQSASCMQVLIFVAMMLVFYFWNGMQLPELVQFFSPGSGAHDTMQARQETDGVKPGGLFENDGSLFI